VIRHLALLIQPFKDGELMPTGNKVALMAGATLTLIDGIDALQCILLTSPNSSQITRKTTMHRICLALFIFALGFPVHADTSESAQFYEQVAFFPADRSLVRPEDGVMLADGTLLIADQVHGLVALDPEGAKRPFGDFAAAGYVHEPPDRSAGPNGVAMEPDGIHVLVADILTGAIYRIHTETEQVVRIYQHEFGANSARRDSSGAVWFTQSTRNRSGPDSEARMFAAVDTAPLDGALFRLPPPADGSTAAVAELKLSGLAFGNGVAIDEARGEIYVAETMANRIVGYQLSVADGSLSEGRVVAELPTPDNIELDASGACGSPRRSPTPCWSSIPIRADGPRPFIRRRRSTSSSWSSGSAAPKAASRAWHFSARTCGRRCRGCYRADPDHRRRPDLPDWAGRYAGETGAPLMRDAIKAG
jgi:sugar lactone lactonase YvrE